MWWRGLILILIIGVTNFTVMDCAEAYDEESPTKYNVDIQRECLDEILIFELRLKIMSVLEKEYGNNYLIGGAHIIPIRKSDSYPQQEFILEGKVMTQDSNSDIVQITFKANTDGYKASDFRVIRSENNNHPLR
ncbi:hypothetical protein MHB77_16980 [Paenibacillus sp. FSL K6-3166]|uniref:hypothetical protein n=1 Tax=unclassified Paenibacillus TaxID=185978 RepID=UPI000BA0D319|nr:hypothetical protein [Paenibacillus sp. VTT E-133291]OZQ91124.1 hypothetical protein CA598_12185 [Paenibacillus sp. VTT E-133291]